MSPDLAFLLVLALRMAVAAAFVIAASIITERSGPVIGALVATLPVSAGPSYVFLALDHDAAFIARRRAREPADQRRDHRDGRSSMCVLAQRRGVVVSLAARDRGLVRRRRCWCASIDWSLTGRHPRSTSSCFAICLPLVQRFRAAKMPLIARRWYDIPLRAALVATLVAIVVTLSSVVGPTVSRHHRAVPGRCSPA